jgi:Cdc6-like AAA superfamily ATPase
MARYLEFELLYKMFARFKSMCLLDDRSLLWPDKNIWTLDHLGEFKTRFIDSAVLDPSFSFEEKLIRQMSGASAEIWGLIADIYYVFFLPSSYITFEKKLGDIEWAAQQGGLTPPPPDDGIWEAQKVGFTRTSLKYHYKYSQFWLIILAAIEVKKAEKPELLLEDAKNFQKTLDDILESISHPTDRAYDMRHAVLYLAFPELYERIISTGDKKRIVKTYKDRLTGPVPEDLDEALKRIRETLSSQHTPRGEVFDFYRDVKSEWRPAAGTIDEPMPSGPIRGVRDGGDRTSYTIEENLDLARSLDVLAHTKNIILYGPPGTGKTYVAKKVAETMIKNQLDQIPTESVKIQRAIDGLTFYDVLALSMYREGVETSYSVPELENQKLIQARLNLSPIKNPKNSIWGYLQSHTSPESLTVKATRRNAPYLFDKDASSHWSLTDEGKEYVEESLGKQLSVLRQNTVIPPKPEDFISWSTFHQSYSYEDFVEGLRPVTSEEDPSSVSYEIVPGIFRRVCSRAANDPENKYVLVIDEINRGNIAKILGELITLLEDDKRGELSIRLPYSGDGFTVPLNLYIIGTMNTADRSIALLDVALRRRFAFLEIMPRPDLLISDSLEFEGIPVEFDRLLRNLNASITQYIDRDHQIGHSYFLKILNADPEDRTDLLEFVWNNQIIPLLEEYFYGQWDKLAEILDPFLTDVEREAEPNTLPTNPIGRAYGEELVFALSKLAGYQ